MTKAQGDLRRKGKPPPSREATRSSRVRLNRDDRARQILEGATAYFAESGFDGKTRELTTRLGVSKGLLYRYFPGKDALIERVYEELFFGRWKPEWDACIADRSVKLLPRLKRFYRDYADRMLLNYEWVRIYLLSGLAGSSLNRRFARFIMARVFETVISELRIEFDLPGFDVAPISEDEIELMWALHGAIFYIGVRKWVYDVKVPEDCEGAVDLLVAGLYTNAWRLMTGQVDPSALEKGRP